jgi:ankyrin repeat protein
MPARQTMIALLICILIVGLGCSKKPTSDELSKLNCELLQAVDHRDFASARRLLAKGANIETTRNDTTLLEMAASNDDLPMLQLLWQKGANAHLKGHSLGTLLRHAAYGGHTEIVRFLLEQNPDLEERNQALLEAAQFSVAVVVIENPQKDHSGGTAVSREVTLPALPSQAETVKLLLDSGADIETTDQYRGPPLIQAAAHAQTDVVQLLLERGANLHARDKYGNTALIAASCECAQASMNSAYYVVKVLLEKGSDVNAHANDGTTALMNAAGGFGGSAIVKLLLEHGADPRARDSKGKTALKYAIEANREDKAQLLKQALASSHKR